MRYISFAFYIFRAHKKSLGNFNIFMDTKLFYEEVNAYLKKAENSIFDKFKLDNSDLVNAVRNNDPYLVAKILNAWVNPNKEDGLERLALPYAVDNNNKLITGMLLARKADPNVLGEDGKSPLTKAVYCCLLYTSPSPRDATLSRMPSSA